MSKTPSIARQMKRGKVDMFGRKMPKRIYNNKKRTPGRQKQEEVKQHYHEMLRRLKYIRSVIDKMVKDNVQLKDDTWVKQVREYDEHRLFFDEYEKKLIFERVNHAYDYNKFRRDETERSSNDEER